LLKHWHDRSVGMWAIERQFEQVEEYLLSCQNIPRNLDLLENNRIIFFLC
jgi:hypothetical protein